MQGRGSGPTGEGGPGEAPVETAADEQRSGGHRGEGRRGETTGRAVQVAYFSFSLNHMSCCLKTPS